MRWSGRELRFRDLAGRETTLRSRRFVSMADSHQAGIEWTLTPENWSGRVEVVSALDGRVTNQMVARYRELEGRHLNPVSPRTFGPQTIALKVQTRQSNIYIAEAARTRVFRGDGPAVVERSLYQMEDYIQQVLAFDVTAGEPVRVEKLVALFTSHDHAITEPLAAAGRHVLRYPDFAAALAEHAGGMDGAVGRLRRAAAARTPRAAAAAPPHRPRAAGLLPPHRPARRGRPGPRAQRRGLPRPRVLGRALRLPVPQLPAPGDHPRAAALPLPPAGRGRAAAREAGYRGAMFPWQSGSDGTEETQVVHLNPLSGQWEPDLSHNQRHVNAAIFYNVWQYYQATDDLEFLRDYGAEMMLEIARFWASIAHYNPERDRYEIHGVMGPDEFHERYPGADEAGLRNNAYTNVMVAWIAATALRVLDLLPAALRARRGVTQAELDTWRRMSSRMFVPFHDDAGQCSASSRATRSWRSSTGTRYRAEHGNIQRLDRILQAEGDDPDRYKVAKQADTVMLFFLFSPDELRRLFERLGYAHDPDMARRTIDYYDRRTSHGSTLSLVTYAGVLAGLDPASSWQRFLVALESDLGDVQGGTTKEGIHMGVMSGTLDLLQRSYAGSSVRDGVLHFQPRLIDRLDGLAFSMQFRGTSIRISIKGHELTALAQAEGFRATGANRRRRPGSRAGRRRPLRVRTPTTARPDAPITHARPEAATTPPTRIRTSPASRLSS